MRGVGFGRRRPVPVRLTYRLLVLALVLAAEDANDDGALVGSAAFGIAVFVANRLLDVCAEMCHFRPAANSHSIELEASHVWAHFALRSSSKLRVTCALIGPVISAATVVYNARTSSAWAASALNCLRQ